MEYEDKTYSLMSNTAGFLQETQRRGQRRCPSKYGILTAKFHLLGEPPKTPLSVEHIPPLQSVFPLVPKE